MIANDTELKATLERIARFQEQVAHLRRVETICRSEGLQMVPIPADFLSGSLPWSPMYAVPQARGFQNVQKALWEYLGALTGG